MSILYFYMKNIQSYKMSTIYLPFLQDFVLSKLLKIDELKMKKIQIKLNIKIKEYLIRRHFRFILPLFFTSFLLFMCKALYNTAKLQIVRKEPCNKANFCHNISFSCSLCRMALK